MKRRHWRGVFVGVCLGAFLFGACGNGDREQQPIVPSAEMKTAIATTADVLLVSRLATELSSTGTNDDTRDLRDLSCPEISRQTGTVTLDYATGCVPESGLVGGEISGTATFARDLTAHTLSGAFEELTYTGENGDISIDGALAASCEIQSGQLIIHQESDMILNAGATTLGIDQGVAISLSPGTLAIDGNAHYALSETTYTLDLDTLVWNRADLTTAVCPLPSSGNLSVIWENIVVLITFDQSSPQSGIAYVIGPLKEGYVDVCAHFENYL